MTETVKNQILARIKAIAEDIPDKVAEQLVYDAEAQVLDYTNRTELPKALIKSVGDLAIVMYNRLGTEGEKSRSEGGESYAFEAMPQSVYATLKKHRLARCGGNAYETVTSEDSTTTG